jgi:hypothetical protein
MLKADPSLSMFLGKPLKHTSVVNWQACVCCPESRGYSAVGKLVAGLLPCDVGAWEHVHLQKHPHEVNICPEIALCSFSDQNGRLQEPYDRQAAAICIDFQLRHIRTEHAL